MTRRLRRAKIRSLGLAESDENEIFRRNLTLAEQALPESDMRTSSVAEPETGSIILSFARKILRMLNAGGMDDALLVGVSCVVPRLCFRAFQFHQWLPGPQPIPRCAN